MIFFFSFQRRDANVPPLRETNIQKEAGPRDCIHFSGILFALLVLASLINLLCLPTIQLTLTWIMPKKCCQVQRCIGFGARKGDGASLRF